METWPLMRMDSLCEITSSKRIFAADYVSEGVPFFRGREITEKYKGNLEVSTELFITENKFQEIERKFGAPKQGDLLLTSVGTLGSVYVVKAGDRFYFKDGNLTWFRNFKGLNSQFLYYWIGSPQGKAELQKCTIGSSQSAFTIVLLKGMEIELPPLPIQQSIADILSAYDELIENSQRRIKILESMARALYREWFVHFRFPGHELHPRVTSSLGEIPKGWEVRAVKDVSTVTYGFPFQSKKFTTDRIGTPVIRIRDILEGSINTFTDEDAAPKYHIKNGNILVGMDGDFHMCIWSSGHAFQNQRVAKFESNGEISNYHLFLALELPIQTWNKSIVGTTVAHLGDMHIKTIQIVWPPENILLKAREILEPMSEQVIVLKRQIQNLRHTRDLLLPRLLSGQIDVSNLPEPDAS
ncbi:type I restriction enzyme, S subunit [Pseudomonas pohangensis]|uniref:Type I restriction enzyme, S subunit n=1 Tax=Pseudomonas pohangensis TaxID=364197 RepID=A0A1H2GN77_9PSED|nr:restriction endonuclease subunit S [Pseudomonas pohangensis]SDU20985.1 type I restriction enzyme, S subunit [Pseudomonas pohangensis]